MMTNISDDCRKLLKIPAPRRRHWIDARFPDGAPAQWWWAMIRISESDIDGMCKRNIAELSETLSLGVSIVTLGVEADIFNLMQAVKFLASFALTVVRSGIDAADLPDVIAPDEVAKRGLGAIRFTPEQALAAAVHRRNEIIEDPGTAIYNGEDISNLMHRTRDEVDELGDLESMLESIQPLVTHIRDRDLQGQIIDWMNMLGQLEIGEEATAVAKQWLRSQKQ